ncbi:MAG: hypothetical protein KIT00_10905 [Rhodospirillales bacterium]|nr:hypothetical protein [Rhodospirillales bacterium]
MTYESMALLRDGFDPDGSEFAPFGSTAEWVTEQDQGGRASHVNEDDQPYDPLRYWDIYEGTD